MSCERTVLMPSAEELEARLQDDPEIVQLFGLGYKLGGDVALGMVRFYKGFIKRVAGKEVTGFGLNQAWTDAAVANLESPITAGAIVHSLDGFGRLMRATVPDTEVLAESLEVRRRYEEELARLGRPERNEWAHLGDWN